MFVRASWVLQSKPLLEYILPVCRWHLLDRRRGNLLGLLEWHVVFGVGFWLFNLWCWHIFILGFIGVKLVLQAIHETTSLPVPVIPVWMSLAVIVAVLAITIIWSYASSRSTKET